MVRFEKTARESKGKVVEIKAKRSDAVRGRLRLVAPDGEDIVIDLPRGHPIHHEDIFGPSEKGTYYKVLIEPESVVKVTIKKSHPEKDLGTAIKLGYRLGNRHLGVLIEDGAAYMPLSIDEDKIIDMLRHTGLPINIETVQKVISTASEGYYGGEEHEH